MADRLTVAKHRKAIELQLAGGTDNRANEALTLKRATTRWPLMAVNMQLSSSLSRARLALRLKWRPREENVEADALTNEVFDGFEEAKRIVISLRDLDLSIVDALVESRSNFVEEREKAKAITVANKQIIGKRFDKTPW